MGYQGRHADEPDCPDMGAELIRDDEAELRVHMARQ
jgi:hypothetical protein